MLDAVILGGTLVDGTGGPPARRRRHLRRTRVAVGSLDGLDAVAPSTRPAGRGAGFIDIHSHSDRYAAGGPPRPSPSPRASRPKSSAIAATRRRRWSIRAIVPDLVFGYNPALESTGTTSTATCRRSSAPGPAVNVATLVGQIALRLAALGRAMAPATARSWSDGRAAGRGVRRRGVRVLVRARVPARAGVLRPRSWSSWRGRPARRLLRHPHPRSRLSRRGGLRRGVRCRPPRRGAAADLAPDAALWCAAGRGGACPGGDRRGSGARRRRRVRPAHAAARADQGGDDAAAHGARRRHAELLRRLRDPAPVPSTAPFRSRCSRWA